MFTNMYFRLQNSTKNQYFRLMLCFLLCLHLCKPLYYALAQENEGFFENVVKELFSKELSSASTQNMTDCMTRLLCENICHRTVNGEIKGEPLVNSARMLGRTESDPLGYFFTGGDRGFQFGQQKQCDLCAQKYSNCLVQNYEHAKSITNNYEANLQKGAESSLEGDFISFN